MASSLSGICFNPLKTHLPKPLPHSKNSVFPSKTSPQLVNINAYHQPGVEAGKKAAGEVLALQKRVLAVLNEASCKEPVEPLTLEEVADRCHASEDIEMIFKIIAHMAANDRAIIAEGSCGSPRSIKVVLGECNVDELYA
ncbi:unnamed protein product [Coffea canephora]|uniref:Uncharacterized protein n=1 Tax=Coffea canephora TaxID=49390 RepID=A0A068V6I6_COFCA|nr:unnamed protein product [Coffea canephora]